MKNDTCSTTNTETKSEFRHSKFEIPNSSFELPTRLDDYIQLSPLGLFPHARGLQKVDRTALENIVKNFKSFFARLGRRFAGLPFYVGHPDVHGFENTYTDRKAYGWIMDLEIRDDGLYGRTKWSEAGQQLIGSGHYKFLSPTWTAEKVGIEDGSPVYRPTNLISVGLTNQPNLPVPPLANINEGDLSSDRPETLLGVALPLEISNAENPKPNAQPGPKSDHLPNLEDAQFENESGNPSLTPDPSTPQVNSSSAVRPEIIAKLEDRVAEISLKLENCQRQLVHLHSHLVTSILDNAIASARILPVERKLWEHQLSDDFHGASAALANAKPQLKLALTTDDLPRRPQNPPGNESIRKTIRTLVNEQMKREGVTYEQAWFQVKKTKPDLFEALAAPAKSF